jgi:hypothetical protein
MSAPFVVKYAGVQYVIKDKIYPNNKVVLNSSSIEITVGNTSSSLNMDGLKISDGTTVATMTPVGLSVKSVDSGNEITLISGPLQPSTLIDTVNSSAGLANQILSSTGTGTQWINYSAPTPTLSTVIGAGNSAGNQNINNISSLSFARNTNQTTTALISTTDGISLQTGPLQPSKLLDTVNSSSGNANQVLVSTGTGTIWVTADLSTVIGTGNSAGNQNINNISSLSFARNMNQTTTALISTTDGISLQTGPLQPSKLIDTVNASAGVANQVLVSTGTGTVWTTPYTPNLSTILSSGNSAGYQSINNISSISMSASGVDKTAYAISSVASNTSGATYDVPSYSQGYDTNNRVFQNKYMEVVIEGTHYYLPLFI